MLSYWYFQIALQAQTCPATNSTFATATLFDPNWVLGCISGITCTGGNSFDNRPSCEATTSLDPCAPAPTCGTATNGSDLWFKFYANASSVTINVIASASLISAIQAFSVNPTPTCASLVEIGCIVAPGINATLNLTGLSIGDLYYYRVYGCATVPSQRTGFFCFCGTSGIFTIPLAVDLEMFSAVKQDNSVLVKWKTSSTSDAVSFELESSTDGMNFLNVALLNASISHEYQFSDQPISRQKYFYRIKTINPAGRTDFSNIITIDLSDPSFSIKANVVNGLLQIQSAGNRSIQIINSSGSVIVNRNLKNGTNQINVSSFSTGLYYVLNKMTNEKKVFIIQR